MYAPAAKHPPILLAKLCVASTINFFFSLLAPKVINFGKKALGAYSIYMETMIYISQAIKLPGIMIKLNIPHQTSFLRLHLTYEILRQKLYTEEG